MFFKNILMLRLVRLDTPGLIHHVIIRGVERWKVEWQVFISRAG